MPGIPIEWVVGPVAALALALTIARELWLDHKRHDLDVRTQRDAAIQISRDQVAATRELAGIVEQMRADAAKRRRGQTT